NDDDEEDRRGQDRGRARGNRRLTASHPKGSAMPRQIIGAAFMSLDGVIQAPGAPEEDRSSGFPHGGWWEPQFDETLGQFISALFEPPFDLLLGRRTYDIFA